MMGSGMDSLADKDAVITGGDRGLGGERALRFATPAFAERLPCRKIRRICLARRCSGRSSSAAGSELPPGTFT